MEEKGNQKTTVKPQVLKLFMYLTESQKKLVVGQHVMSGPALLVGVDKESEIMKLINTARFKLFPEKIARFWKWEPDQEKVKGKSGIIVIIDKDNKSFKFKKVEEFHTDSRVKMEDLLREVKEKLKSIPDEGEESLES